MITTINSATFKGIIGETVKVEVDISKGLPTFNIVGLGDTSIKESKERVRAAIINSGYEFPLGRITVNLAPADLKKEGSIFDASIAIGILMSSNQIKGVDLKDDTLILGELSLDGGLSSIKGVLPIIYNAKEKGLKNFIVPFGNEKEAGLVKNISIYPMKSLKEVIGFLEHGDILPYTPSKLEEVQNNVEVDFKDVFGQESAKRALEISAAGGHNILLYGPCGSGKSMLAKAFKSILPYMNYEEALEVAKIYSIIGEIKTEGISLEPPFRSPHHSITDTALIGGGHKLLPGEISLAHRGVLFLDEILEFKKNTLELLREPLEEKYINITRMRGTYRYPCDFTLISSMNP
ncbi:YifB family Mg chelatase-like AAA ATPase [Hathewaya histolytica]|uniref:Mg chelatase-like protein n=1 Tax=Hathewaya histolytica TaxID=1498 RepID=A0A4U9RDR2_HATHI|nr:YifB family Mg chelatase-like AAA ATPase [Hathewaya histolytica]VTQ89945.1 Mg chelatase-like protein [Hathewaya histolytica]